MRYWWVNQNQTFRQEVDGGYLWSPKRSALNRFNQFYENMREVAPGDIVFSFCDTYIRAVGIAQGYCYECPKPSEFGGTGRNWESIGWRVDIRFTLTPPFRPREHMDRLGPLLPAKYSPLQQNGSGNQAVYLAELPPLLGDALGALVGDRFRDIREAAGHVASDEVTRPTTDSEEMVLWEDHLTEGIRESVAIPETARLALVQARRGQGLFRERVAQLEKRCRITRVDHPSHLIASHAKPWRDSSNEERLDGENGLLLTPTIDHLFDRGFISFEDGGRLLISPVAHTLSLQRMGVDTSAPVNVGSFSSGQKRYLDFHRNNVFLERRTPPGRHAEGN